MNSSKVSMYVCGPTVYDDSHIGHARTYMTVDLIHRVMKHLNKETFLVMNITDIDDKIINKSSVTGMDWKETAKKYEDSFFHSMKQLNIEYPHVVIRVSEVIPQIIDYIQTMMDKGFAYPTKDGSIYFDTEKYKEEGYEYVSGHSDEVDKELFPPEVSEISESLNDFGVRNTKKSLRDFALWKGRKVNEVGFEAKFKFNQNTMNCFGRPGWHIECSTMIHETLGEQFDIHFGGIDLKFPHHYNENAQANAFHHPKFLQHKWCDDFKHTCHLCIEGLKMSKSLKNFTTINEILKITSPNVLRWLFMKYKWYDPMNYSEETLKEAKQIDEQVEQFFRKVENYPFERKNIKFTSKDKEWHQSFIQTKLKILQDLGNFEFDLFVHDILDAVKRFNIYLSLESSNESLVFEFKSMIENILHMLGFKYEIQSLSGTNDTKEIMEIIIDTRTSLRQMTRSKVLSKEDLFVVLDKQRKSLSENNIELQDTKENSLWWKK